LIKTDLQSVLILIFYCASLGTTMWGLCTHNFSQRTKIEWLEPPKAWSWCV